LETAKFPAFQLSPSLATALAELAKMSEQMSASFLRTLPNLDLFFEGFQQFTKDVEPFRTFMQQMAEAGRPFTAIVDQFRSIDPQRWTTPDLQHWTVPRETLEIINYRPEFNVANIKETVRKVLREELERLATPFETETEPESPLYGSDGVKRRPGFATEEP